eukprot:2211666-Amphidinium_carterae.1
MLDYGAEEHSAMLMFSTYGFTLPLGHHNPDGHGQCLSGHQSRALRYHPPPFLLTRRSNKI